MENNSELQIRLRKNQNTLVVIGLGVIAFGVWSVIKTVLYAAFNTEILLDPARDPTMDRRLVTALYWVFTGFILAVDLALRLYVGRSAIAEGRGRKKRVGYIVLALLLALLSLIAFALSLLTIVQGKAESYGGVFVSVVVELTSGITLVEMALSAIKVKRLSRKLAGQGA